MTSNVDSAQAAALLILGPDESDLLRELDRTFAGWGFASGARELIPPPVYQVSDLAKLDVYANFPHLSLVAGPLRLDADGAREPVDGRFAPDGLVGAHLGLPSATCYGAYLYHQRTRLPGDVLVTLVNRCFRNEDHYEGLRRLLSFQMREVVALGSYEHTQRLLEAGSERVTAFAGELGLRLDKAPATDPFFHRDGARALLAQLSPVKHEFSVDGLAIASVNTHRNFFGERCDIRLEDDEPAFTSCLAFGLERWVAVLLEASDGDAVLALERVRAAARRVA